MSHNRNAVLVRRYFEECVSGASGPARETALAIADELLTDEFAMFYNSDSDTEATFGRERHKEFLVRHAQAFPDDHWTVEVLVADKEAVACQWRFQARHAETGNKVDVRAADFFVVSDGRLAQVRRFLDFESFQRQFSD